MEEQIKTAIFNGVDYTRQLSIFNPSTEGAIPIVIVGAGAVGSFTALTLAKMGFWNITVYDYDLISQENIPNQFYPVRSIGQKKVDALYQMIMMMTNTPIVPVATKWSSVDFTWPVQREGFEYPILIACTDNMDSRKEMFVFYVGLQKDTGKSMLEKALEVELESVSDKDLPK